MDKHGPEHVGTLAFEGDSFLARRLAQDGPEATQLRAELSHSVATLRRSPAPTSTSRARPPQAVTPICDAISSGCQRHRQAAKPAPPEALLRWLAEQDDESLFIATFSLAEIRRGILEKSEGRKRRALEAWFAGPEGPTVPGRRASRGERRSTRRCRQVWEGNVLRQGRAILATVRVPASAASAGSSLAQPLVRSQA